MSRPGLAPAVLPPHATLGEVAAFYTLNERQRLAFELVGRVILYELALLHFQEADAAAEAAAAARRGAAGGGGGRAGDVQPLAGDALAEGAEVCQQFARRGRGDGGAAGGAAPGRRMDPAAARAAVANASPARVAALAAIGHPSEDAGCIRAHIAGEAGTGKSRVLIAALALLESHGGPPGMVAVAAPTGVAAVRIGAQTLHSLFSLSIHMGSKWTALKPHDEARIAQIKVVIVDEVSMVTASLLDWCNRRLREAREGAAAAAADVAFALALVNS